MERDKSFKDFLLKGDQIFLSHLSVDCVIFGFHEDQLKVLLLKWKGSGQWCLPGGFVMKEEHIDDSANRILKERTSMESIYLKQFRVFGDPQRERKKEEFINLPNASKNSWIMQRFITIGYYALVEFSKVTPEPDVLSEECKWWDIHKVPKLVYDHNHILAAALDTLRMSLNDYPVGYNLLSERFTMPELQTLYETILGKPIDRRNFQKKMLALGLLERLKERKTGGAHKAPYLYRFDKKKYEKAMKQGLKFGF